MPLSMLKIPVTLTIVFPLCMPAAGVIVVIVVVPAVLFMPVMVGGTGYILPVGSVSLAYEITQCESDSCNSSAPGVSTIQEAQPPWRDGDAHAETLPSSPYLILPAYAIAVASALLLPGGASSLLRLFRP
jgi:hypothetical protein